MATSKNNVLTHGLSGTVGDLLVFRNKGGQVIVSSKPKERTTAFTEAEKMQHLRFQKATIYGKSALLNADIKAAYADAAKAGQTPYNVAVADFFHAPDIDVVDVSAYTGRVGDLILVHVTDDFKVAEVVVSIYNADGSLVEEGSAVQSTRNAIEWVYTAKVANSSLEGDRIEIAAYDLPGNETVKSETL